MEMIVVPAGEFLMGEGEDLHSVYVAGFALAQYPVTNAAYRSFVAETGYLPPRERVGHGGVADRLFIRTLP